MGGWAPSSQAQLIRVCDTIALYIMGFYVITSLIKERIIMIKQLTEVSLKSLDMINKNADGLKKLAEFLNDNPLGWFCSRYDWRCNIGKRYDQTKQSAPQNTKKSRISC